MKRIPARYRSAAIWAAALAFYAVLFVPMFLPNSPAENAPVASRPIQLRAGDATAITVPGPGERDMTGAVILRPELPPERGPSPASAPAGAANSSSGG